MTLPHKAFSRPVGRTHGVLVVDKPPGLTSHQVVNFVRQAFGTKRVGHAGTLDPMATGVLVVLLGEATKLSEVLTTEEKSYEALVRFGSTTDSLDADGKITKRIELEAGWLDADLLAAALFTERERSYQIPPQVSAIKVGGVRSYARARKGEVTELAPRRVSVHELSVLTQSHDELRIELRVSKGYYVRSLARDLGDTLGVPAHLVGLRRLSSGPFTLAQATGWPIDGGAALIPVLDAARRSLPLFELTEEGRERAVQGKRLTQEHFSGAAPEGPPFPVGVIHTGQLIALLEPAETGMFRVKRGFNAVTVPSESLQ